MKRFTQLTAIASIAVLIASCGSDKKEGNAAINDKKAAIEKLKSEKSRTDEEIRKLQEELAKIDSNAANEAKIKLVNVTPVTVENFKHYIDLRGKIDAENISYITPRGMGGQVKAIFVKEGQPVKKGQLLLKLDDAIQRQSVVASRQQLEGIKTQLGFAKNIYDRQKNLWEKGIGTEVQLITAKTNVQSLENQLSAASEQVKVAVEQLNTSNIYSDVSGVADIVNVKVGELFSGMGQIKIVNTSNLKAIVNVPENYITRIRKGSPVVINIPDAGKTINTSISLISQSVDPTQRGFSAEARVPTDAMLKPNQLVVMKILDYAADNAVVISVNTVQSDEKKKKIINIGEVYGEFVEVKTGLAAGEQLITEGYQNLYDGQLISTVMN